MEQTLFAPHLEQTRYMKPCFMYICSQLKKVKAKSKLKDFSALCLEDISTLGFLYCSNQTFFPLGFTAFPKLCVRLHMCWHMFFLGFIVLFIAKITVISHLWAPICNFLHSVSLSNMYL